MRVTVHYFKRKGMTVIHYPPRSLPTNQIKKAVVLDFRDLELQHPKLFNSYPLEDSGGLDWFEFIATHLHLLFKDPTLKEFNQAVQEFKTKYTLEHLGLDDEIKSLFMDTAYKLLETMDIRSVHEKWCGLYPKTRTCLVLVAQK